MNREGKGIASVKREPVFELIKSMSKAEKRNFKLYATRLSDNRDAKFIALFDTLDSLDEYDEVRVLSRCDVTKSQLPNMKAHLYRQILVSIRLLETGHNSAMQVGEQIDFARILYDKGHYHQSLKTLDKAKEMALAGEHRTMALEITEFQKVIEGLHIMRPISGNAEAISLGAEELCRDISSANELSNISISLHGLYLKLGHVRSQRDLELVRAYFAPRLEKYDYQKLSLTGKMNYCKSMAMYSYIGHDFLECNKHTVRWMSLFDTNPAMKRVMYDNFLTGYSRLLEGLFFLQSYRRYEAAMKKIEAEREIVCGISRNAEMMYGMVYFYGKMNGCFLNGDFSQAVALVPGIVEYIEKYGRYLNIHHRMLFYYKIACAYFGNGNYTECISYLGRVISTRDPQVRRDLQCYARVLNLIASYEAGMDYNLDYQIKSVYTFLVKMNDMHEVQREMIAFIKRLNHIYVSDLKAELTRLYERLKPYTSHPYERRTFFYLDIISWLESKIRGVSVASVIQARRKGKR